MSKRFTELSFIIGVFFTIVALILLIGYFTSEALSSNINMYTGIILLAFGLFMILITPKDKSGAA